MSRVYGAYVYRHVGVGAGVGLYDASIKSLNRYTEHLFSPET